MIDGAKKEYMLNLKSDLGWEYDDEDSCVVFYSIKVQKEWCLIFYYLVFNLRIIISNLQIWVKF